MEPWGTLRIPWEDWGTLGKIKRIGERTVLLVCSGVKPISKVKGPSQKTNDLDVFVNTFRECLQPIYIYLGCGPLTVTVTTRIITFLVGNPYKPSFTTVTVRGPHPIYTHTIHVH